MTITSPSDLVSIETICFELLGYPVSCVELIGALTGLVSVYLAARSNIWTWPTGLINVTCFFLIFFQVQLYSDMFLQVYFFVASIYGWIVWRQQDRTVANPIHTLSTSARIYVLLTIAIVTGVLGLFVANIHTVFPNVFAKPASFPYLDTFIAVLSVLATLLLARRLLENWILWILVDVLSIGMYMSKGVVLIGIEYFIFLCIAAFGFWHWLRIKNDEERTGIG